MSFRGAKRRGTPFGAAIIRSPAQKEIPRFARDDKWVWDHKTFLLMSFRGAKRRGTLSGPRSFAVRHRKGSLASLGMTSGCGTTRPSFHVIPRSEATRNPFRGRDHPQSGTERDPSLRSG